MTGAPNEFDADADVGGAGFAPVPSVFFLSLEQAAITMIAAVAVAAAMSGLRRFMRISILCTVARCCADGSPVVNRTTSRLYWPRRDAQRRRATATMLSVDAESCRATRRAATQDGCWPAHREGAPRHWR